MQVGPPVALILEPEIGNPALGGDSAGFSSFVIGIGGMLIFGPIIDNFHARRADSAKASANRKDNDVQP